jgi:uncharacterized membrane protein
MIRHLSALLGFLSVAVMTHVAVVLGLPLVAMHLAMATLAREDGASRFRSETQDPAAVHALASANPDLMHAVCSYDVQNRAVRISATLPPGLWSLSLYAANTDNYLIITEEQVADGALEVIIYGTNYRSGFPPNSIALQSPSRQGVAVMRVVAGATPPAPQLAEALRRAGCEPYSPAS